MEKQIIPALARDTKLLSHLVSLQTGQLSLAGVLTGAFTEYWKTSSYEGTVPEKHASLRRRNDHMAHVHRARSRACALADTIL